MVNANTCSKVENIIIIDDEPANNFLLEYMINLQSPVSTVSSFVDSKKALSHISSVASLGPETTILLDLNMPEMNGWELLDKIEALNIECGCFIVSSSINQVDKRRVANYPFVNGYLIKPLSDDDIKFILRK